MKLQKMRRYNINQCALYKCRSKKRLARLLRTTNDELNKVSELIQQYRSFTMGKKNGGERKITAPPEGLKKIQKRILKLFVSVERPAWLISGERGKCYIDNGKYHQHSKYFLTVDIRKFYDNCSREYVYRFFQKTMHMTPDVAKILTDIVTLEDKVPTGCPTSQMLAFYAYQEMFESIHSTASQKHGCLFTLYVDDMTFSSGTPFNPDQLSNDIDVILRKYGHKPKYSKVKYFPESKHKLVTGVVITENHELVVANNLRKKIYEGAIHQLNADKHSSPVSVKELRKLKGQLQAARNVDPRIFPEVTRFVDHKFTERIKEVYTYRRPKRRFVKHKLTSGYSRS